MMSLSEAGSKPRSRNLRVRPGRAARVDGQVSMIAAPPAVRMSAVASRIQLRNAP